MIEAEAAPQQPPVPTPMASVGDSAQSSTGIPSLRDAGTDFSLYRPIPAPTLTAEKLKEWRWYLDPKQQQSRAQCDRQPMIGKCFRNGVGRPRVRPEPVIDPIRAPNGYDRALDTRAYSPNNRVRGFLDLEEQEIARENAFTPVDDEPQEGQRPWVEIVLSRTPSPLAETGSLESRIDSSLAESQPDPSRRPIFYTHGLPSNAVIRSYEVRDFVRRFAAKSSKGYWNEREWWSSVRGRQN